MPLSIPRMGFLAADDCQQYQTFQECTRTCHPRCAWKYCDNPVMLGLCGVDRGSCMDMDAALSCEQNPGCDAVMMSTSSCRDPRVWLPLLISLIIIIAAFGVGSTWWIYNRLKKNRLEPTSTFGYGAIKE
ncbi:hypothetical protein PROFUN_00565 [Planoprotostelium fungivorum]|uniref:Uncharacterized protein n=1 Tax=Planoprotostelium fungivorum TaxID=1890364 RepID=A0A2P6N161_9EUKA|nr:hypothetical protein PROFUN_00565 [Planoprotostelium fungivorum]